MLAFMDKVRRENQYIAGDFTTYVVGSRAAKILAWEPWREAHRVGTI